MWFQDCPNFHWCETWSSFTLSLLISSPVTKSSSNAWTPQQDLVADFERSNIWHLYIYIYHLSIGMVPQGHSHNVDSWIITHPNKLNNLFIWAFDIKSTVYTSHSVAKTRCPLPQNSPAQFSASLRSGSLTKHKIRRLYMLFQSLPGVDILWHLVAKQCVDVLRESVKATAHFNYVLVTIAYTSPSVSPPLTHYIPTKVEGP